MTATTAYTDNSGEVLIEEIAALNVRIDLIRDEFDPLLSRLDHLSGLVVGAHATFRARVEALERGTIAGEVLTVRSHDGIERVAIVRADGAERLEQATNVRLDEIAVDCGTVTEVQAFSVNGWPMVLIRFVTPEGS